MNKGRIYFIVVTLILAAVLGFVIYSFYTGQYGAQKVNAVISLLSATDSISYKEIIYNVNRDEITITDIEVVMETGGKVTVKSLLMDSVYAGNIHNLTAVGFRYDINDRAGSAITAETIHLTQFNPVSLVDFVIRVQSSTKHEFYPSWITGQFDMQQMNATYLTYTRADGGWIKIGEFGWQGPLIEGEFPGKLNFTIKNATAEAGHFAKLLGKERLEIPSASYERIYDGSQGLFYEKLENVVLKDLFTFTLEYELSNFHMEDFLQGYYDGMSHRQKIIENTYLDNATFTLSDTGFIKTVSDILLNLIMMDSKTFARMWLERGRLSGIENRELVSELVNSYIETPEMLKIILRPTAPVPLKTLNSPDKTHLNDLNVQLYVNSEPPVDIRVGQTIE